MCPGRGLMMKDYYPAGGTAEQGLIYEFAKLSNEFIYYKTSGREIYLEEVGHWGLIFEVCLFFSSGRFLALLQMDKK